MPFNPLIPQATDEIATSQSDILDNFGVLGAIAGNVNPSSASINNTSGFNWVYLPPNGAIPPSGAAFTAGNVALYSALSTVSTLNELYINKNVMTSGGPVLTQIPSTAAYLDPVGWSYLPSGMLMKWGQATSPGAGSNTITFPVAATIPAFSDVFTPILTPITIGLVLQVTALTNTVMTVQCSGAGTFYFLVNGR
jgi:hypothetical protein